MNTSALPIPDLPTVRFAQNGIETTDADGQPLIVFLPEGQSIETATVRVALHPDQYAPAPEGESLMPVALLRSNRGTWYVAETTESWAEEHIDGPIERAYDRFARFEQEASAGRLTVANTHTATTLMERYLRIFHGFTEVSVSNYLGYTQSDWGIVIRCFTPDFLSRVGLPADHKRDPWEGFELTSWARGDAWSARLERLAHWSAESDRNQTRTWNAWEPVDAETDPNTGFLFVHVTPVYGSTYDLTHNAERELFDPNDLLV